MTRRLRWMTVALSAAAAAAAAAAVAWCVLAPGRQAVDLDRAGRRWTWTGRPRSAGCRTSTRTTSA